MRRNADRPAAPDSGHRADRHAAIAGWLAPGAAAWRRVLTPLTPAQRDLFVETLRAYEAAVAEERGR
ncbi:hypothetical protein [Streptomyces sp. Ag109_O5-1]|uniref:hypothetical protein n=1 Tax=Streptomyces sp. Ag109_O5-1 TaxID=1938851 RepID=UPI001C851AFE|nr:hypothetical protein [Streptomyces sp. Ag109_O5-1]